MSYWYNTKYVAYLAAKEREHSMKGRVKIINFVPVVLWMAVIFFFSSQPSEISSANNQFIIRLLNSLGINIQDMVGWSFANFIIRKAAHVTEYFILFILTCRAFDKSNFSHPFLWSAGLSFLYSMTDEFHQLFVPGRGGSIKDVLIDSIGIAIGIIVISLLKWLKGGTYPLKRSTVDY